MGEWKPESGKRAWFAGSNVDVLRVFKGGTVTIRYWGRGLQEGDLVTHRGLSAASLSPPRKLIGGEYVEDKPVMVECEECAGHGQVQAACVNCGKNLTTHNSNPGEDRCLRCEGSEG